MKRFRHRLLFDELNFGGGVWDYQGPGWQANTAIGSTADNSGLVLMANNNGAAWNDFTVYVQNLGARIPASVGYIISE